MKPARIPGSRDFTVLVVAKAPVSGLAKTRLCPPLTPEAAAYVAASALIDTLTHAVSAVDGDTARVVVSMTGDLTSCARHDRVMAALDGCQLIEQRGTTFGMRLTNAHIDTAELRTGTTVVQIGMDTPHASPAMLQSVARLVTDASIGVLGDATDGGWWVLAIADPSVATVLRTVPMSRQDTGERTRAALTAAGLSIVRTETLTDVDTWEDAVAVASAHPRLHFAESVRSCVAVDYLPPSASPP